MFAHPGAAQTKVIIRPRRNPSAAAEVIADTIAEQHDIVPRPAVEQQVEPFATGTERRQADAAVAAARRFNAAKLFHEALGFLYGINALQPRRRFWRASLFEKHDGAGRERVREKIHRRRENHERCNVSASRSTPTSSTRRLNCRHDASKPPNPPAGSRTAFGFADITHFAIKSAIG